MKKVSSADNSHLSNVEFLVTKSDGSVVGDANGKFVTDSTGTFLVEGVEPGTTLVIKETRAKPGFLLDDAPQTVQVKEGQTVTVEFRNQPLGNLVIEKWGRNGSTEVPLEGVKFEIKYANGQYVDAAGGTLSSNGIYYSDSTGKVILSGITGTVVVTELESVPGYTIDPDSQSQTVTINPNDTQTIRFYNNAVGGVELIKVSEADKTERIPNTTFEIRRVSDNALVDTVTTGESGSVFVTLEDNNYYAVEIESAEGFKLDSTPHHFTIKNGQTTKLTVTNAPMSGILLHKISTADGKGIPGVSFILYDSGHNPIDQQTTDDRGYAWFEDLTESGRYYLRELENEGYIPDTQLRTVYEGQNLQHQVGNEGAHQVLALPGIQQRHSNALCHRVPHLLLGADIYRADNIQRKQPQLHRQVRHSLQLLPHGTKRINTPRMIFTIIFQRIFPPLLCQTVVPSGKYSIMLCIRRRNARQVSSRLR